MSTPFDHIPAGGESSETLDKYADGIIRELRTGRANPNKWEDNARMLHMAIDRAENNVYFNQPRWRREIIRATQKYVDALNHFFQGLDAEGPPFVPGDPKFNEMLLDIQNFKALGGVGFEGMAEYRERMAKQRGYAVPVVLPQPSRLPPKDDLLGKIIRSVLHLVLRTPKSPNRPT